MSINPHPDWEKRYASSSMPNQEKINSRILYSMIASEADRKIIARLLQQNFAEAKDLEEASGLSRSAALNRADKLVDSGVVDRQIKPGTENRHKPPYIFSLLPEFKKYFAALLKEGNTENEFEMSNHQVFEASEMEAFGKKQESKQLDFSENTQKLNTDIDLKQDRLQHPVSQQEYQKVETLEDNSSSLEKRIGKILTEMAKEIATLRSRVADLEEKLEQNPQNTDQFDFDNILNILDNSQNGKDTS